MTLRRAERGDVKPDRRGRTEGPEKRPQTAFPWRMFLLLWGLAFCHRLFFLLGNIDRSWPFPIFYEGDAETFYHYAQTILAGGTYDAGVPFHPPLFPLFLAFWYGLLGAGAAPMTVRIVLAAVFALQVPLLWILLRKFLAPGAALAGAVLALYAFGLLVISTAAVSEGLYLVLLLGALLLFAGLVRTGAAPDPVDRRPVPAARAVALGLLLGLLALTRAEGLGAAILLIGWGAVSAIRLRGSARMRRALAPWAVAAGGAVLCLVPWTVRNAITLGGINRQTAGSGMEPLPTLVVTTAYGPLNFALANHADAPGYFTRSLLTSGLQQGVLDLNDPQHREYFLHGYRHGLAFVTARPGAFLALAGRKLAIAGRAFRLGWTQWDLPGGLRGTRYPVDLFTPDAPWAVFVHLALLLPGIALLARRPGARGREYLVLTGLFVLLTFLLTIAFFGYVRQAVLVLPLLFGIEGVTLAAACAWVAARVPALRRGRPVLELPRAAALLIALFWLAGLAGAFQSRNYIASGETLAGSKLLNRDSIMQIAPK